MIVYDEEETIRLGEMLGSKLEKGDTVILKGDLASGKTTFTKGIGRALHVKDVVNSPTFTILKIHEGDIPLYHIDAYRLDGNDYDLGIDEYQDEVVSVIEWPEYYKDFLPAEYIEVDFRCIDFYTREITLIAHGRRYERMIEEIYADSMH